MGCSQFQHLQIGGDPHFVFINSASLSYKLCTETDESFGTKLNFQKQCSALVVEFAAKCLCELYVHHLLLVIHQFLQTGLHLIPLFAHLSYNC